jgi:hypothetical protein
MNKIKVCTAFETKVFKIGDIVQASPELKKRTLLEHGFKFRIISIVNNWQVIVRVVEHDKFSLCPSIIDYKKDELKRFEFKIAAEFLDHIKIETNISSISGFGF